MNAREFIWQQVAAAHELSEAAMAGVTEAQLNWNPPEHAVNPIKTALVHVVAGEDMFIQRIFLDRPLLWETGQWGAKIGLPYPPGGGRGWDEARNAWLPLTPVLDYAQAACSATNDYLANLTEEELDRSVSLFGRQLTVAATLARLVTHIACHAGEIATVKGMQGIVGLPF